MEEMQPWWKGIKKENREEIKRILYRDYDMKKNYEKQVLENIKRARKIFIDNN